MPIWLLQTIMMLLDVDDEFYHDHDAHSADDGDDDVDDDGT